MLPRTQYLNKLIQKKDNGRVKIITGLRRSGKSVLLFELYKGYLLESGVSSSQIIELSLDVLANAKYRNPIELDKYIREQITDTGNQYYVLIDEIQFVSVIQNPYCDDPNAKITFVDVVLGLMQMKNVDVYVTGSNSRMLSTDILTQFRDRGDEIRVYPLSFGEFHAAFEGDKRSAWQEYYTYGGMPVILSLESHEEKSRYLRDLFNRTYLKDVIERNRISNHTEVLSNLLDILASGIGSLTNPYKISNTFLTEEHLSIAPDTIDRYLGYFMNAFLIHKANRYDVKGRKYIGSPLKYYFEDVGLRNARLDFRQVEETHLMENILYNELRMRGYNVDVGAVSQRYIDKNSGSKLTRHLEIDFVANLGSRRYYIQSAFQLPDAEKVKQEKASLLAMKDSFKKIIIVKDVIKPFQDNDGILTIGLFDFLQNDNSLEW